VNNLLWAPRATVPACQPSSTRAAGLTLNGAPWIYILLTLSALLGAPRLVGQIINLTPYTLSTVAGGSNNAGFVNGTGAAAEFWNPQSIAVDAGGNVYVGDIANCCILFRSKADGTSTLIAANTGWAADAQVAAAAGKVGAFSWGAASTPDSALLITLAPGGYTAQVAGATGVALVEIYQVD